MTVKAKVKAAKAPLQPPKRMRNTWKYPTMSRCDNHKSRRQQLPVPAPLSSSSSSRSVWLLLSFIHLQTDLFSLSFRCCFHWLVLLIYLRTASHHSLPFYLWFSFEIPCVGVARLHSFCYLVFFYFSSLQLTSCDFYLRSTISDQQSTLTQKAEQPPSWLKAIATATLSSLRL